MNAIGMILRNTEQCMKSICRLAAAQWMRLIRKETYTPVQDYKSIYGLHKGLEPLNAHCIKYETKLLQCALKR